MADEKETQDAPQEEEAKEDTKEEEKKEEESPSADPQDDSSKEESEEKKEEETKDDSSEEESESGEDVEVPEKFQALVEQVENMSVLELNELVKLLEKKFGVSAQAVAAAPSGDAGAAEEKDEFTVELTSAGDSKIGVIKAVKAALGLGLKEAKDLVESAPAVLKEDVKKEEAEEMKAAIEEAGGKVELK